MSERFNFVCLIERLADDGGVRAALLDRIRSKLARWIGNPTEVFLLGEHDSQRRPWADAQTLLEGALSDRDILFVYFSAPEGAKYIVVSIKKRDCMIVYNISFPIPAMSRDIETVSDIASILYEEISAIQSRSVVTAGAELEIEASQKTVEDLIDGTRQMSSLVEFVCCDERYATQLGRFVVIKKVGSGLTFRRS